MNDLPTSIPSTDDLSRLLDRMEETVRDPDMHQIILSCTEAAALVAITRMWVQQVRDGLHLAEVRTAALDRFGAKLPREPLA